MRSRNKYSNQLNKTYEDGMKNENDKVFKIEPETTTGD